MKEKTSKPLYTLEKLISVKSLTEPNPSSYISKAVEDNSDAESAKAAPRASYLHLEPRQLYSLKAYTTSLNSLTRL